MRLVLDTVYMTIEEKLRFMDVFGYKYLNDRKFKKNVDDKVIVFERNNYITYTDKNNFQDVGNSENNKWIVKISNISPIIGAYSSKTQIVLQK